MQSVGIFIPVYEAEEVIESLLRTLEALDSKYKVLIALTESKDNTESHLKKSKIEYFKIAKSEFNHGLTREQGRKQLNTDYIVYLTQDVVIEGSDVLDKLLLPLIEGKADASYPKQLPRLDATLIERIENELVFPDENKIVNNGISNYHCVLTFASDCSAVYSNKALEKVGGFPKAEFMEDLIVVNKIISTGGSVVYLSDVTVRHSNPITLRGEFYRAYFTGMTVKKLVSSDYSLCPRVNRMKLIISRIAKESKSLLLYFAFLMAARRLGYYLGKAKYLFTRK